MPKNNTPNPGDRRRKKQLSNIWIGPKGKLFFMVGQSAYIVKDWKDLADNINT